MTQPTEPSPPPYDGLLARLEKERAHHESCAALSRTDEGRIAHSGMAAGFHIAAIRTVEEFEGPGSAREYMERTTTEAGIDPPATLEPDGTEPASDDALREQYAEAARRLGHPNWDADEMAAAIGDVRDRRMEQLASDFRRWVGQLSQKVLDERKRAEKAEATIARVRAECDAIARDVRGKNPVALAGFREANARVRAALDGPDAGQTTQEAK